MIPCWSTSGPSWLAATTLAVLGLGAWPVAAGAQGKFRVAQVLIVGNTETPDYLIRLHIPFRPGEAASGRQLRLAQSRLRRAGLWPAATVSVVDRGAMPGWGDIVVRIEEGPWNWLLSAGYELALFRLTGDLERLHYAALRIRDRIVEGRGGP